MSAQKEILIEKTECFSALLDSIPCYVKDIWTFIVGYIRTHYVMDEFWDGHSELKFRRSGKTLLTIYLKPDKVSARIIFGKAERESFELQFFNFSKYINTRYNDATTYHDGKWMVFDIKDMQTAREIALLTDIKKKPTRKFAIASKMLSPCGKHCDICPLYKDNAKEQFHRKKLALDLAKCLGDFVRYSDKVCPGCSLANNTHPINGGCECYHCAKSKGLSTCAECDREHCSKKSFGIDPGLCIPGLSANEVTEYVIPFCRAIEVF